MIRDRLRTEQRMSTPEPSGDHGYDLAHQDLAAAAEVQHPPSPEHRHAAPPPPPEQDPAGDYGYDEAHRF
jgi:hypothetical protein